MSNIDDEVQTVKVLITVPIEVDIIRSNYGHVYNEAGEDVDLTEAEQAGLTVEQCLEYDYRYILNGDFDVQEYISYGDHDNEDIKLQLVEQNAGSDGDPNTKE